MADAVVVPGANYGAGTGMMMYVGEVAAHRGAAVHRHSWSVSPPRFEDPAVADWVAGEIAPVLDGLSGTPLVIGKSLGSHAAGLVADRGLPAIWMTPLLHLPWVVAALERATAPFLLVGGTADRSWDGAAARRLSPHVTEIDGGDHGLRLPGPLPATIDALRTAVVSADEFLDTIGWP